MTARGQTVIPAEIRQQFHLSPSDRLEWVVDSEGIHVIPVKSDPIAAFRGRARAVSSTVVGGKGKRSEPRMKPIPLI